MYCMHYMTKQEYKYLIVYSDEGLQLKTSVICYTILAVYHEHKSQEEKSRFP